MSGYKTVLITRISRILILLMMVVLLMPTIGQAYSTKYRWPQNQRSVTYWIYTDLSDKLFPTGGSQAGQAKVENAIKDSAFHWNISSGFRFDNTTTFVNRHWDGYDLNEPNVFARVFPTASGVTLSRARTVFNTGPEFTWHTNGTMGQRVGGGWNGDVFKIALHEWGHWLMLQDYPARIHNYPNPGTHPGNSVMWIDTQGTKGALFMDDKEDAVMTYGIDTGFEQSQFLGLLTSTGLNLVPSPSNNSGAYQSTCTSSTTGTPDYWTYASGTDQIAELLPGGNRFMRFRGCAKSNSVASKAYMTLAGHSHLPGGDGSGDQGALCGSACYQKIQSGMNLRWMQRNAEGCAAIISLEFTDGTYLHSTQWDVRDTGGRSIIPGGRCNYFPPGTQPHYVQINFNSIDNHQMIGKTIRRYLVVYDNTGNIENERWRIYFDGVTLSY